MIRVRDTISRFKDILHISRLKAIQEQASAQMAKEILPWSIVENKDHVVINNERYIQCIIAGIPPISDLGGYPENLNIHMIDELLTIKTNEYSISYSYMVDPIANLEAMHMIDESQFNTRVDIKSYKDDKDDTKQAPYVKQLQITSNNRNIEAIFSNAEKMFNTALIIVLKANSRNALRLAESHVRAILESSRVYYQFPDTQHLKTFISAQLTPTTYKDTFCQLFTYHSAALFPTRNPNSRTSDSGLLFGVDWKNPGKNILIDLKSLSAQHVLLVGPTGSGKTYSLFLLLMRAYSMLKKRIIYITPKADVGTSHRNVSRYFGDNACIIDLGPSTPNQNRYTLNPLEIIYDSTANQNQTNLIFMNHINILEKFFTVLLLSDTKSDNMLPHISRTIYELYKRKGISEYDMNTWKNWPVLKDLYDIWKSESDDNSTARALMNKFEKINLQWAYLNKQSDIDIKKDFIIFDTSGIDNSSDKLQDAFNVLITSIMGLRFQTDFEKETIIAVDEAAVFLRDPRLSLFLLRILTQGRSHGLSLWLATQQLTDIQKAGLDEEFMTNMQINICMGNMTSHNISLVADAFKFDQAAQNDLLACKTGEGLVKVGEQIIPVIFKATPLENEILKGRIKDKKESKQFLFKLTDERLRALIDEKEVCFQSWLSSDTITLDNFGWDAHTVIDAITGKKTRVWLKSRAANQKVDHYANVARIKSYLIQAGLEDIIINDFDDVDLSFQFDGKRCAIEYERPGSHTESQLIEKGIRAKEKYDNVLFVCQNENYDKLKNTVGADIVVRRGKELVDYLNDMIQKGRKEAIQVL